MIELAVPAYCQNCPDFDPDVNREMIKPIGKCTTYIKCKDDKRCAHLFCHIWEYLKEAEEAKKKL